MNFSDTSLWRSALQETESDRHKEARSLLREGYFGLRKNAACLVENISADLRQFTIHDITHLDALWGVASEIVGSEFKLTPTEAFVLGAAFLLHDAGMCLASYPGGLPELSTHKRWPTLLQKYAREPNEPTESEVATLVADLLRTEHANRARDLVHTEWSTSSGGTYYLLEKAELRQKFGYSIGELAASHWWSHERVAQSLDRIMPAPPPFPTEWHVDLLKVASILRVADAAHIDERRAPGFVWALRRAILSPSSELHWLFQNRLTQPERRGDALYYSSTSQFLSDEAEAWWLAYDSLRMIDHELGRTDVLLADLRGDDARFAARRVANVESTKTMMNSLQVSEWIPIDTMIRISDVPTLVRNLGGEALYGRNPMVPVRELVQNAADALRLKAAVAPNFKLTDAAIRITRGEEDGRGFLEVSDNGIGMTKEIVTGPLLDFRNSGWSSDPAFLDHPGINPAKLNMIGKFGIGFFSVFMLGDRVEVNTRRFDQGYKDTLVLSFSGGIRERPILRPASQREWSTEGGTSVRVWLRTPSPSLGKVFGRGEGPESLRGFCQKTFPTIDVSMIIADGQEEGCIRPINWREIAPEELLCRINGITDLPSFIKPYIPNMRPIFSAEGEMVGRLFLAPRDFEFGVGTGAGGLVGIVAARGILAGHITGLYGIWKAM